MLISAGKRRWKRELQRKVRKILQKPDSSSSRTWLALHFDLQKLAAQNSTKSSFASPDAGGHVCQGKLSNDISCPSDRHAQLVYEIASMALHPSIQVVIFRTVCAWEGTGLGNGVLSSRGCWPNGQEKRKNMRIAIEAWKRIFTAK